MKKILCAMLVAAMALLPLQAAQAGMIGLQGVAGHAQAAAAEREALAKDLEALGVPREAAQERVAALSDEDTARLAAQAASAPAGGNAFFLFVTLLAVFAFVIHHTLHPK